MLTVAESSRVLIALYEGRKNAFGKRFGQVRIAADLAALANAAAYCRRVRVHRASGAVSQGQRHSRRAQDVALHAGARCFCADLGTTAGEVPESRAADR